MNPIKKQITVLVALLATGIIFFISTQNFEIKRPTANNGSSIPSLSSFPTLSLKIPRLDDIAVATEAWIIFQNYLEFARTHNFAVFTSLSHQISPACFDPSREKECFALMDSVYSFSSYLEKSNFKYIQADERQIIMYTDAPTVAILYFTKDDTGTIKVLGLRFCFEDESTLGTCVKTDSIKGDEDGDGWWDSVESLFY